MSTNEKFSWRLKMKYNNGLGYSEGFNEMKNYIEEEESNGNGVTMAEKNCLYNELQTAAMCSIADSLMEIVKTNKSKAAYKLGLISVNQFSELVFGVNSNEPKT